MLNFQYFMPTRVIFGPETLNQLGDSPHLPRGKKAMIVVGESGIMIKLGYLARVQSLLSKQDVQSIVFDKIMPNPESDMIDEAAAICRENDIDFIIGLGGGSTIDSAKAIALMATNTGKYWDYMQSGTGGGEEPQSNALPIVAIPTTAGTGTEADPWTVITKSGSAEKIGWGNDSTFPTLSIVDPALMISVPPRQTAYTGMDAFFHAVEAYLATCRQPASDMLALEAVHLIAHTLPEAVANGENLEARTVMAWASSAAGLCESYSSCISQHSLEHALSAFHPDLPHGAGLVLISKAYFGFLASRGEERLGDLALAMGDTLQENLEEDIPGVAFLDALDKLIEEIGLGDEKLSDYGVTREEIPMLAENALTTMGALFDITPVTMSQEDVIAIFEAAYQ
ncbi:iron-containing alcohol dehydrogenase [Pseudodesulfovibrio piezophilus]|uniref:Fe-containing alcohol dehydrogenase n=1 Tax=Pseudodesulfovibrio piezophilus (strain DSM 21447 / JCM 15486 / C1TLV30) TaxID=1322246 RepID=M1WUK9_PSEP2|nr:iron-containing alcohol dehydrogenase [Pseudodesulfovibrio piezophilus]CCH47518.1 Fe-containing alcohol dehydrogenase [Pseudodesulfovibrio piezophilus C1TLV30]